MPRAQILPQTPEGWGVAALGLLGAGGLVLALWPTSPRARVVRAAESQIGQTDASPYWADVLPGTPPSGYPKDWCGAFALWCLHQAGLAKDLDWIVGRGFLFNLPTTTSPQPGDIAYFDSNEHQAVVVGVSPAVVSLINGNGTAGAVSPSTADISHAAGYYSIAPLLPAAESDSGVGWMAASAIVIGAAAWTLLPGVRTKRSDAP